MNAQQIFDTVVNHLRTQKVPAYSQADCQNTGCAYKNNRGQKCAVGCLVPENEYSEQLEMKTITQWFECKIAPPTIQKMFDEGHRFLLARLQMIHDCGYSVNNPDSWEQEFRVCARDFKLQYSESKV